MNLRVPSIRWTKYTISQVSDLYMPKRP
uniref:Uncharacterized protein n=1 Tax=Anguilla anguilla TaxID=7936 RepID=A0A0E9QZY2_ANGAN